MVKFSIITINLNNIEGLKKTIESIVNQTITDFEYIVIDGGSVDGSVEILKRYHHKFTYCVSETDRGIYHAMNKGISQATGEYVLFLNSGDYLFKSNILEKVSNYPLNEDLIIGSVILTGRDEDEIFEIPELKKLTFRYFINSTLPHPGTFIKRTLFDKIGHYNEQYEIASDFEFFLKAVFFNSASLKKISETIAVFDGNGISSAPANVSNTKAERLEILKNNFPKFIPDYEYLERLEIENKELFIRVKNGFWYLITKVLKKFSREKINIVEGDKK